MAKANKTKAAATTAATVTEFEVLEPIRHDGDDYVAGETIELTDAQAAQLLGVKAIKALPVTAAAPEQPSAA